MKPEKVVSGFFEALESHDFKFLKSVYAINCVYKNPIFDSISGYEAARMWEMFLKDTKSASLNYKVLGASRKKVKVFWTLNYVASNRRKVSTSIRSEFEIQDDQIYSQTDKFGFSGWVKQALGTIPWLFCLTGITQTKVKERAEKKLNNFARSN